MEKMFLALFSDLVKIKTVYGETMLNVRLDAKWVSGDDRKWMIRVDSEHGGINQEEMEAVFKVLAVYEDKIQLYCEVQNNALQINIP